MTNNTAQEGQKALVRHYYDQEPSLPHELKPNETILLYAMSDLSSQFKLWSAWLILTPTRVLWVSPNGSSKKYIEFQRLQVHKAQVESNISHEQLILIDENGKILLEVYFSKRQRRSFHQIQSARWLC